MEENTSRVQKLIAATGYASRRKAEELILAGRVIVEGKKITDLAVKVGDKSEIRIDGIPLKKTTVVSYALNKPKGYVCSTVSQNKDKIITELVPKWPVVNPVGRLDKDSEGLILLSNDGELSFKLAHPSYKHQKTYHLICKWQKKAQIRTVEYLKGKLLKGVKLGDGDANADKVDIKPLKEGEFSIYITIHEGRNHILRRMLATLDLEVKSLKRIKINNLELSSLKVGQYKILSKADLTLLA